MSRLTQMRALSLIICLVSGHLPVGCAEVCRAFAREVEAVMAVSLSVSIIEHMEPRESVRALSVCLGCHIPALCKPKLHNVS